MEQQRSKKAKSLRAAGKKSVNNEIAVLEKQVRELLGDQVRVMKGLAPAYVPDRVYKCVRRYIGGSTFSAPMTLLEGHGQFAVATSATTAVSWVDCWKINRIRVYARNDEGGHAIQVNVVPIGIDTGSNNFNTLPKHYDVESQSTSVAMILEIIPGKNSPLGSWHRTNTVNSSGGVLLISTSANGGGTLDANTLFEIEYGFQPNVSGGLTTYTSSGFSGLTIGALYTSPLCGGLLQPLDVNVL